ncbi:ABC transporter permease [Shewanella surugensis]|uniref:ABC transporter permease n=1 Tax=Shewanella surugensis TaxID=212020 RepID=A0ABT0L850_9GAMM|nr:ABC transporter permease subunit [Shewanella surugensis]MCL1123729.1 ABC transporter permease [Shewanella surugensis]
MDPILTIAIKEFQDGVRNRWFISITIIFSILSLGLSYYGAIISGELQFSSISSIIASLSSLAVFIIPLITLLLSYDAFVGEQESGTLLLLFTYPISTHQLLLGKFLGHGLIISISTCLGFGSAMVLLLMQSSLDNIIPAFSLFIATAILLGLCFISIAYVISLSVNEVSKAVGVSLIVWFFFVFVFDFTLLAMLIGIKDGLTQGQLVNVMLLNPADLFRLINFASLMTEDINGVLAVAINASLSLYVLILVMLSWIVLPLLIAAFILRRKTL